MGGFYMAYLESLCRRRNWPDPGYVQHRDSSGWTCIVYVNGREYKTDLPYESDLLAQENAAMRAFMVCRSFSQNGGMLARNGIVQGLPVDEGAASRSRGKSHKHRGSRPVAHHGYTYSQRPGHHSSSSSTASFE